MSTSQTNETTTNLFDQLAISLNEECKAHFTSVSSRSNYSEVDTASSHNNPYIAPEDALFHLANVLFLLAYLSPSTRYQILTQITVRVAYKTGLQVWPSLPSLRISAWILDPVDLGMERGLRSRRFCVVFCLHNAQRGSTPLHLVPNETHQV